MKIKEKSVWYRLFQLGWLLYILIPVPSQAQEFMHGDIDFSCESCHTTENWKMREDTSFDHADTGFQLTGQHESLTCESCHPAFHFADTPSTCASCHTDIHLTELGDDCLRCHTTNAWEIPGMRQMHQETRFPLLGSHFLIECQACHPQEAQKQYRGTPIECVACHRLDYQQAQNPNHFTSNFPTGCDQCHRASATMWTASFDHASTGFPLVGVHLAVDCNACHVSGSFTGLSSDCVSCHFEAFMATTNPNHAAAGFSTDCEPCHNAVGWSSVRFVEHDTRYFRIYSGEHRGEWAGCESCHTNPATYMSFTCLECHEHRQDKMDDEHDDIGGYVYMSPACLSCHPDA